MSRHKSSTPPENGTKHYTDWGTRNRGTYFMDSSRNGGCTVFPRLSGVEPFRRISGPLCAAQENFWTKRGTSEVKCTPLPRNRAAPNFGQVYAWKPFCTLVPLLEGDHSYIYAHQYALISSFSAHSFFAFTYVVFVRDYFLRMMFPICAVSVHDCLFQIQCQGHGHSNCNFIPTTRCPGCLHAPLRPVVFALCSEWECVW